MHTHVIRTTADKLDRTVDDWLGYGETPAESVPPQVVYVGGRDFLVVIRHPEHPSSLHDGHGAHAEAASPVVVHAYRDDSTTDYAGWIEDEARSWIIYLDRDWRPAVAWMRRDSTGAVIDPPVRLDVDAEIARDDTFGGAHLTAWFEAHPELIGEGSAVDNAIRLLTATYDPQSLPNVDYGRLARTARDAPTWFQHIWNRLADRQIIDVDYLRSSTDTPRWVIDYLESPLAMSEAVQEFDTREDALRRILAIAQGGPAQGTSRSDWALEALGEVRGLAISQVVGSD